MVRSRRWWRRATLLVVAIAFVHAATWAVLTPLFQGPDEIVHYGYTETVAESGRPPVPVATGAFSSPSTTKTLIAIPWSIGGLVSWDREASDRQDRISKEFEADPATLEAPQAAGYQAGNPPLYNYVTAVPYLAAKATGATVEGRLVAIRLTSALLGALAVLFVLLFLRELLPRRPVAVVVGALAVALQPVYGWLAGTANNDLAVTLGGAILLYGAARAFRRGLDLRSALILGGGASIGMLSKVSAYGLLAAAAWCTLWLLVGQRSRIRMDVRRIALAVVVIAVVAYLPQWIVAQLRQPQGLLDGAVNAAATTAPSGAPTGLAKVRDFLSYLWQFYLPRAPGMDLKFPELEDPPVWQVYLQPFMGRFGWFEFGFSTGQSKRLMWLLAAALVAALTGLWRIRATVRRHWAAVVGLVGSFVGYAVMINIRGWQFRDETGQGFEQVRYLFPMIGFYGLLVALALTGLPARWRRPVAAGAVVLMLVQVVASFALTFDRYYV
jgi:4-amino-4-deoxy-L-arabinose transferase-like glycosyltransferase